MTTCIFCEAALDAATKQQHIIPAGVGGSLSTSDVTCTGCNEFFSSEIDSRFLSKYQYLLNQLPNELFQGFEPPTLKMEDKDGEGFYCLPGGRRVDMKSKYTWRDGKLFHVQAPSEELLEKILNKQFPGQPVEKFFEWQDPPERTKFAVDPMYGTQHDRMATKILLELLDHALTGTAHRPVMRDGRLREAIGFTRRAAYESPFVSGHGTMLGAAAPSLIDEIFSAAGCPSSPFPHRVLVGATGAGHLIGVVEILGGDCFGVVLSEKWTAPLFHLLYQRSVFKGTSPTWQKLEETELSSRLTPSVLHEMRARTSQEILDAYDRHFCKLVDYRDLNADEFLSDEFAHSLRRFEGELTESHVGEVMELRLSRTFAHQQEAWKAEWPRIREEFLRSLPNLRMPESRFDRIGVIRDQFLVSYKSAYRLCRAYVGRPQPLTREFSDSRSPSPTHGICNCAR